jgi:MFS family permease
VGVAGASIGLVLGGVLTQAAGWHWIFFVDVPIGMLTGLSAAKVLQGDRGTGLRIGAGWLGATFSRAGRPVTGTPARCPGMPGWV